MLSLMQGDALTVLRQLPPASVQTCVTSPPYFGLRDYATAPQVFGGAPLHVHEWSGALVLDKRGSGSANADTGRQRGETYGRNAGRGQSCACGAWLGQLGLEPRLDAYVRHLVDVFRAVREVLAADGTLWLNLGDAYSGSWGNPGRTAGRGTQRPVTVAMLQPLDARYPSLSANTGALQPGLKNKDLLGVPWAVAVALRDDGWYLRSDIVWAKPNPMPESVKDRPTRAHEYLFLLAKSRRYFYNADAIREPAVSIADPRNRPDYNPRRGEYAPEGAIKHGQTHVSGYTGIPAAGRNKRDVWTIPPKSYRGAHFAVMPPALVEPCILAGSRPGDTVLDPFVGSGTVLEVARNHGRDGIGIDLNPAYLALARERLGLLEEVA